MIEARDRREGFIGDSLWDRRRYFKNEDKINELVNHPIQSGGAVIVNEGMIELIYGVQPWFSTEAISPTGKAIPVEWLINHGHDALYLEVNGWRRRLSMVGESFSSLCVVVLRRRMENSGPVFNGGTP